MFRVAELFTGTGAFSLAFKNCSEDKFQVVYANDFEPSSKVIFDVNNTTKLECKDLNDVRPEDIPEMDILTAGFPCFVRGMPVMTAQGYVNIENVDLNSKLLTHKGVFQSILNKQSKSYTGNLHTIKCMYLPDVVKCTEEHPFFVRQIKKKYQDRKQIYEFSPHEWRNAKDIDGNSFVGIPINSNSNVPEFTCVRKVNKFKVVDDITVIDKDFQWFMLGYFLGDGWVQDDKRKDGRFTHKIFFVIANDQIDVIKPVLERNFKLTFVQSTSGCTKFVCSNKCWWEILKTVGKYAHGKFIPEWIENAPKEMLWELIKGYASADGNFINHKGVGPYEIQTVSLHLALGVQRLLMKVGIINSVRKTSRSSECVIQGRTCSQRDTYKISWYKNQSRTLSFIENGYAWVRVKYNTKEFVEDEHVFNFEVENDNSYVVNNLCVHNCQPFSIAGMQNGFDDARSNVFWKIVEILKHHRPRIAILENVKNLQSHDKGNTFKTISTSLEGEGYKIKYKILNTCTYTDIPQNRERIYILCFRENEDYQQFEFPEPTSTPCVSIASLLSDNVPTKYYYTVESAIWEKLEEGITEGVDTNAIYQYRRYYVRKNKSGCCPTLTANMGTGGHNVPIIKDDIGIRKLTPRECFKLQGFPEDYIIPNNLSDAKLYKLAGNAVSVPVVKRIINNLIL